jgi:hypothetical protein
MPLPVEAYQRPAANTAAVASLSNGTRLIRLKSVSWSYTAAPTNGSLTISDGTRSRQHDITTGGPGFIPLDDFESPPGVSLTATLAAGGAGITGSVWLKGEAY